MVIEKAKVFYDGLGGIALISASDDVKKVCSMDGSPEVFDGAGKLEAGLYDVELQGHYESCYCGGCGVPCGHSDYLVFDVVSKNKVSDTVLSA